MSVLPKERMGEVVPVSFGGNRSAPTTSTWRVGEPSPTPTENVVSAHDGMRAPQHNPNMEANPSIAERSDGISKETYSEPVNTHEPPVFEIPEDILRAFYEEAVAVGLEDGKGQVFAELTVLQERYAAALEKLRIAGEQLAAQNQTQIIQLSCLIAEKIVRSHLKLNPNDLLSMIQEAIQSQEAVGTVNLFCSTGDYEFLDERLGASHQAEGTLLTVHVKVDEALEYGDFRLETNIGSVDGSVADRVSQVGETIGGIDGV